MKNISIVLVEPINPGNIGSTARAMKNTGFSDLVLINPVDYRNNEAYSMACRADDVLLGARVFEDIKDAVRDGFVVGTTRRKGKQRCPVLTIYDAVDIILRMKERNRVYILFGREDKGLKNHEVSLCDILVEIPAHPSYPSINLSHAVYVLCYTLFTTSTPPGPSFELAPRKDVEDMYNHLEKVLSILGYGEKGGGYLLENIMRNTKRLLGRTGLMQKEVNMLRGILTRIEELNKTRR